MDRTRLQRLSEHLRDLHRGDEPLVLPNAWDAGSAREVVTAGFPVVATTSGGMARSLGWADNEQTPPAEVFAALGRITRAVDVPVTADIEAGYRMTPAELADALLEAGVVGCNLEDTDHAQPGELRDATAQAERIAAIKDASRALGVDTVLNARIDVFIRQHGPEDQRFSVALDRSRLYLEAGADCLYPIGADRDTLAAFVKEVSAPVNGMVHPNLTPYPVLRQVGIARISFASSLHRSATAELRSLLDKITVDGHTATEPPTD